MIDAKEIIAALRELPPEERCRVYVHLRDDRAMLAMLDLKGWTREQIQTRRETSIRKRARQQFGPSVSG